MDGNLKLILGLIWTLILHYSISMPMWGDEDNEDAKKLTPKQRLLGWIQNKVPQLPISNFHRDWRDGKALGALVDNCAPGGCKRAAWCNSRAPEPSQLPSWSNCCCQWQQTHHGDANYVKLCLQVSVQTGKHGIPVSQWRTPERPCSRLMIGWEFHRYHTSGMKPLLANAAPCWKT